jgi:succinate dehydrogenase / fumarate reductase, iron-sulfur subunit
MSPQTPSAAQTPVTTAGNVPDPDARRAVDANRRRARPGRRVLFRIKRCDGPGKPARWEEFSVPVDVGANVISCLQRIAAHPVTTDGKATTPVVWDSGCLEEVCGACTMVINGRVRQSCSCLLDDYAPEDGDVITLEPMSKFPVVRDLWVDRARMFATLERLKAWVPIDGTYDLGPGPAETPEKQEDRYVMSTCMTCGCCLEACPQYNLEEDPAAWGRSFVGAFAISQVRLFNDHVTGGVLKGERLDALMGPGGVDDCGQAQNCVKVCPKHIPLTESIGAVDRSMTFHAIARWFSKT